ncbi:hypothetical protein EMIT0232MI5_30315 [Pseudomonas sp. IT-232MI5]
MANHCHLSIAQTPVGAAEGCDLLKARSKDRSLRQLLQGDQHNQILCRNEFFRSFTWRRNPRQPPLSKTRSGTRTR